MNNGAFYEQKAEKFLFLKGYRILERNFRVPCGEIDLIGKDRQWTAFIEVKARHCSSWCEPQETVTDRKQERLKRAALRYLYRRGDRACRFDVVSIIQGRQWRVYRLFKNAFSADERV